MTTNDNEMFVAYCAYCKDKKLFSILAKYTDKDRENEDDKEYAFSYCNYCKRPSLFYREDFLGIGLVYFEFDTCMYPKDERIIGYNLPQIVRESYDEAVKCEKAKASIATVVMVGRSLEAICKDFVPESQTINSGLQMMKDNGLISDELLEWSNELRFLRNQGAHATPKKIKLTDAIDSLDFLQAILEILYHLRPRFKDIKELFL